MTLLTWRDIWAFVFLGENVWDTKRWRGSLGRLAAAAGMAGRLPRAAAGCHMSSCPPGECPPAEHTQIARHLESSHSSESSHGVYRKRIALTHFRVFIKNNTSKSETPALGPRA